MKSKGRNYSFSILLLLGNDLIKVGNFQENSNFYDLLTPGDLNLDPIKASYIPHKRALKCQHFEW